MKSSRERISFRIWWAMARWRSERGVSGPASRANQDWASTTLIRVTSVMFFPATVKARDSGRRRAPWQVGQGLAAM